MGPLVGPLGVLLVLLVSDEDMCRPTPLLSGHGDGVALTDGPQG